MNSKKFKMKHVITMLSIVYLCFNFNLLSLENGQKAETSGEIKNERVLKVFLYNYYYYK
jgi:hypothetical protein